MRKYEPIWERLKKEKEASVLVPRYMHPRVIKAVKKEKNMDFLWRTVMAGSSTKYQLFPVSEPSSCGDMSKDKITFYLSEKHPAPKPKIAPEIKVLMRL